jgi:hypothetical protein
MMARAHHFLSSPLISPLILIADWIEKDSGRVDPNPSGRPYDQPPLDGWLCMLGPVRTSAVARRQAQPTNNLANPSRRAGARWPVLAGAVRAAHRPGRSILQHASRETGEEKENIPPVAATGQGSIA